tara:strand:+ start:288 stop:1475 length:1188 start_codon:yes stop_codon:yes gene_type:complete
MSNYTKTTNFATKDSLPSGNAAKIVKGTEIDTEFNNIATAIATKADSGVITDGSITTAKLADSAVTTVKIADDAVTGDKLANNITIAGELVVTGDLTVSGDDITMGTNTSGNLLIADGSNFNSVAVGSLSEISTVASDDVFLAVDTSGGGLKKITRSTVVAGLATSSAISNVVEDTSPQLGSDLDVNGNDIVSVSNGNINLLPNGSGKVIIDGNGTSGGVSITDGNIDIRTGTGAVSKIKFYCETSNAHAQTLQAQAHSASSSAVLTLPVATGTLIGSGDSGTVATGMIADGAITSAKLAVGAGGAYNNFSIKTGNYTAVARDQLIVNSSSAVTITLPASPSAGDVVFIKNAGTGTVTVARNGSNINSTADDGELTADAGASLVYVDSTIGWKEL